MKYSVNSLYTYSPMFMQQLFIHFVENMKPVKNPTVQNGSKTNLQTIRSYSTGLKENFYDSGMVKPFNKISQKFISHQLIASLKTQEI